jgi:hypothetical protein
VLQTRVFVLPGETVTVELGEPDADRNCFPTTITHISDRWTVDWKYSDRNKARDIYKTRTFLKAEAMVQLADTASEGYVMTEARLTHLGTGEQWQLKVREPQPFAEVSASDMAVNRELTEANESLIQANARLPLQTCLREAKPDVNGSKCAVRLFLTRQAA